MSVEVLKERASKTLKLLIFCSVLAVVAVPAMVIALVNGPIWWLAVPCIVIVVSAFYGLPLGWAIAYPLVRLKRNLAIAIVEDGITDINQLAVAFNMRVTQTLNAVRSLIQSRLLLGYQIDFTNKKIVPINKPKASDAPSASSNRSKCSNCGAPLLVNAKACCYCNTRV